MVIEIFKTTKQILHITDIKNNILILLNNTYAKVLRVYPINYNLKSNLEKQQLESQYSNFLKVSNVNFQVIIKTKKQNINEYINYIKQQSTNYAMLEDYCNLIYENAISNNVFIKEFYIVISVDNKNNMLFENIENKLNLQKDIIQKELKKCGNRVEDMSLLANDEYIKFISTFLNNEENFYEQTY